MTDVSWMLGVPSTLKSHSSPSHCIDGVLQISTYRCSKPAAYEGPPHSSSCLANPLPRSLPTALLSGFPIPVTSCPHMPTAVALLPHAQFGVKPLLISQSGLLFL